MKNNTLTNGLLLGIFAVLTTALVAVTYALTKHQVEASIQQVLLNTLAQVIPPSSHDNDLASACHKLVDEQHLGTDAPRPAFLGTVNDKPSSLAIEAIAPNGYNGAISLIVGMKIDGTITGVRVLEHQETPGLGDKVDRKKTHWVDQFLGMRLTGKDDPRWAVKKDGGQFDQFTGATITPRAVVGAVKQVQLYYQQQGWSAIAAAPSCDEEQ